MKTLTLGEAIIYICKQTGKTEEEVFEMPLQKIMALMMSNQMEDVGDE
ncbi:hypothetical protein HUG15_05645 [Salicibibacter cibarius]|uniref:Uncharacterized protein n=1 Tax=Salicibibacter cibarius TaxID=2743000 RepID=A0A7T7CAQ1_9BACI|nr:hypothetical protein [Salicibibacter cibarius]QQK75076.1 hypothetical protein HUG15_05310 [Salicibibacter cibarius]QQK75137.1 hypothetical protein HUG15_05645 [Salicibibacter cibarius]